MKRTILVLLGAALFASAALADYKSDIENGVNAFRNEEYPKAYRYFKAAYAIKPSENLAKYLKQAEEKYKESTDSLMDDAGVDDTYGGWSEQGNIFAMNPLFISYGTIALYYERKILNNLSIGFNIGYSPTGGSFGGSITNAYGYVAGLLINMFPEARALNGWFVGPEFHYYRFKYDYIWGYDNSEKDTVNEYFMTYGMHGGYRWIFSTGFIVDISVGIVMKTGQSVTDSTDPYYYYDGLNYINYFQPSMGCNVGCAF